MLVQRAPFLLWGAVLGSFLPGGLCGSPSHSLSYFYLYLPEPSQGLPKFTIWSYLDGEPIARFDSLIKNMASLVPWMKVEKVAFLTPEWVFGDDLKNLSKLAGGFHTWQAVVGCEMLNNVSKGGVFDYGYDGWDFISFDKETLKWLPAHSESKKVKEKWEKDPKWSKSNKFFLEKTCIEELQRYLSYKNMTQEIEPPVGNMTHKAVNDSLEVLICQAFGFYPKEIRATWRRDGKVCEYVTLHRNVAPNSDGTYYVCLGIEIDPKERDRFQCYLEQEGFPEPLVVGSKKETGWWILWTIVAASILVVGIIFLKRWWRKRPRRNLYEEVTSCSDQAPSQSVFYSLVYGAEDESQTPLLPPMKLTSGHKASNGLKRTWSDSEI